ncbi:SGNH/GDSL hydrolase family protein [Xylocopilactobacillus apis]|uniref:Lysophospholipase n=1 Tax=Xylocopilactobacillus apis TaxID=2932183 RepID=A0AAU9DEI6_9LACO|nr:SGNH/GDSL hydrolase family protein [Xylocopilactobacillus apis]BDR56581.1 lysophospholipase [Xylocopilactobacillus apis]
MSNSHKKLSFFLIFLLLFGFTGCQNHQKSNFSIRKVEKKIKTIKKKSSTSIIKYLSHKDKIIYAPFGDSLSVGLFADQQSSKFSSLFAQNLSKKIGKNVIEKGLSEVAKTAANFGVPSIQTIIDQKPDLITIEFGTNDAVGGKTDYVLNSFKENLLQIVNAFKNKTTAKLILMTTWSPSNGKYIDNDLAFDQKVKEVGKMTNTPVADLSKIWRGHPEVCGPAGKVISDFSQWGNRDDFHPNQIGHQRIAQMLFEIANKTERKKVN